jgi:1H-pyrrole-2-carbonyl-[peptidyl-carrier protein] chlorinase
MVADGFDFDVGIIGGGPAGASIAAYLARAGVSCVVFESELFPRPHVGESLVPSSNRVFQDLDFIRVMEENRFPRKYGAVWTAADNPRFYDHDFEGMAPDCRADIDFADRLPPGVRQIHTYHVDRGKFDLLLLQHANQLGAKVYEGVIVRGVDFSDPDGATIHYSIGKREVSTRVRMVADATGRRTLLARQLKWRIPDPVFDQYAIHTWFDGFDRQSLAYRGSIENYIFVHFLPLSNTWMWQIPITETITSIGVVTQKKNFPRTREAREQFFWDCLAARPELHDAVRASTQMRPFKEEGDYSYACTQLAGDRLVLVGDAGRFVDPIFSTGVSIALNSSRFASRDIIAALERDDLGRASFETFETTMRRGTRNWYRFISVYYRLNLLFTAFVTDRRYKQDVLKLLQGDVYDEDEPEVLTKMRGIVTEVERNPDHIWHDLLGGLTANAFVALAETP